MTSQIKRWPLTLDEEAEYICACITQYQKYYQGISIKLNANIASSCKSIEHDLLWPLLEDAFTCGIYGVKDPSVIFDIETQESKLIFSLRYKYDKHRRDERTAVTFLKFKEKLETSYPGRFVLCRKYQQDVYHLLLILNCYANYYY
ncbi:hypothetical protein MUY27_07770 [Mucilaginibacter sp. RS28]|uniref:Uncharacterized protein n=1 Tax=Mucilaginibacter straminoryzae TaxID=2932774 RepID=A0A9X1X242_9SPHI|nr:hypothetical protein [Mucilaginibacter straminoryzae]MCJ8209603.1 hypothetical protein [Mucilaginibacter straminoryzae]